MTKINTSECRQLRLNDPKYWTLARLAKRYNCTSSAVSICLNKQSYIDSKARSKGVNIPLVSRKNRYHVSQALADLIKPDDWTLSREKLRDELRRRLNANSLEC